ncbi:ovochymase-2-like [Amphiura filiformis]|uniref:ovochymase-2-like n=1 Tax=Amphiura filiformis TaxID=82378 RepID=UPI003B217D02
MAIMKLTVFLLAIIITLAAAWQDDPKCGLQTVDLLPETQIVGGQPAQEGEYPWQAAVYVDGRRICGASLVAPDWIITAAHCIDVLNDPPIYEFMLGSNSLSDISENSQKIPCSGVYVHPMYGENANSSYDADIALMKMERPFEITDHVRTVCVPQMSQEDEFETDTPVTITGWGTTFEGGPQNPDLFEVTVPVVDQQQCVDYYAPEPITDNMICAGLPEGGKDSCQGDSGGPLVGLIKNPDGDRWYLGGVVSWGFGCARPELPGVYTRVTEFEDWIAPIYDGGEPDKKTSDCDDDEFLCRGGWCISSASKCNGGRGCYYSTDELYCDPNSIFFNPFYFEKLSEESIIDRKTVEDVDKCAELCLAQADICAAFDVTEISDIAYDCNMAGATYEVLNTTGNGTTVHFKIEKFPAPGSVLTSTGGRIATPKWIQGNTDTEGWFTWTIKPSSSNINSIVFSFQQIQSQDPTIECTDSDNTNMVIIRSGSSIDSPAVAAFCLNDVPETFKVSSSAARLEFYTPAAMDYGFLSRKYETGIMLIINSLTHFTFTSIDYDCDNQFIETTGTFQSPFYPDGYINNLNCKTLIQAPEGLFAQLDIIDFSIEFDGYEEGVCNSNWDTFRVYNGMEENDEDLMGEFCGDLIPPQFVSTGMYMLVVFKTDSSATARGYKASVSFTDGVVTPTPSELPELIELRQLVKDQDNQLDAFKFSMAAVCVVLVLITCVLAISIYTVTARENKTIKKLEALQQSHVHGSVNFASLERHVLRVLCRLTQAGRWYGQESQYHEAATIHMVEYDEDYVNGLINDLSAFKFGMAAICVLFVLLSAVLAVSLYTVTKRESKMYNKLQNIDKTEAGNQLDN